MTTTGIDWSNVEAAAKQLAGNWRKLDSFAWSRGYDLEDRDRWCIWYTSHRDARLLEQSNEKIITDRLRPFSEGDDPDLVFESHSHWAVGYIKGFSVRVYRDDGSITPAFEEFCRLKEALDDYPILDDEDYTAREHEATLENYCNEMWRQRKELPEGWEAEVYGWFCDHGLDRFIENRDDQGGWAPREQIIEALRDLGLLPTAVVDG
jgi:hypothetical protein